MKPACILAALVLLAHSAMAGKQAQPLLLTTVKPLPMAIDPSFQFRKEKIFLMTEQAPTTTKDKSVGKEGQPNQGTPSSKSTSVVQEASITFERQYRLFGAITKVDQHQRFGDYFDFFWHAKRPADLTVRLEYRQEKLHGHVQAQEVPVGLVHGSHKTSFRVVGDDYYDGGKVLAWRCLLVENGTIVAETRSFLWR